MKKQKQKEYCVHIFPHYTEMENIEAKNPEEAELIAMENYNGGNYQDISHCEVMIVHNCYPNTDDAISQDNDITNTHCENCGGKL